MLQNKDIKKIDELKTEFTHRWLEVDFFQKVINIFNFSNLLNSFSHFKKQGYHFTDVLSILLILPFLGIANINLMQNNNFKEKKDVFYRLKNNPMIDWRSILWLFVIKFVNIMRTKAGDNDNIKCLIIDDSFIEKTGRTIEKISRMWDHVSNRFLLGYKLNLMGFWDGISFIPIDFAIHREKGKNKEKHYGLSKKELKKQYRKKRKKNVASFDREQEADQTKIETGVKMFKRAIKHGLKFDYLLMDSWYTCNEFIELVRGVKSQTIHLIGMYKIAKTQFIYNDKSYTYSQIRNLLGKPKRNRKTGYYYLEAIVLLNDKPIKLFFSKKGKNGKWKTFLTTNTSLSFIKMLEIYAIRWSIEVFFKESKQLLSLGKDHANDFDSQIASATLVMIQYIMISTRHRFDNYESKGELFRQAKVEIFRARLSDRLWGLLLEILNIIIEIFENEDADELIEKMFNDEKLYQKIGNFINFSKMAA